jgi:hypothetical protein
MQVIQDRVGGFKAPSLYLTICGLWGSKTGFYELCYWGFQSSMFSNGVTYKYY